MSNLTSFILATFFLILSIWGFYFLIKKWPKFYITIFGKILKVIYALMLLLAIIISLVVAYDNFHSYWEDDRVRIVTKFQGVQLGWSKEEVLFRKGEPTFTDAGNKNQELIYGAMTALLDKNKVIAIQYDCKLEEYSNEKVGGISCNDDVDRIIRQYGEAKITAVSDDKLRRLYNYPKYNLAFALSKSKVDLLTVIDSKNSPEGYKFKTYPWEKYSLVDDYSDVSKYGGRIIEDDASVKDKSFTVEENAEFQARYDAEKADGFDPDAYLAEKAGGEYVTDKKLLAELNSDKSLSGKKVAEGDLPQEAMNLQEVDHCAPDLTKTERLRRLALKGAVRETGYQTYSTGNYEIVFSADNVIRCR